MMNALKEIIEKIVSEQRAKKTTLIGHMHYPVDIILTNGNILLRAFRIVSFAGHKIKGITWREEYCAPREKRKEIYSHFELEEIKSLNCFDLDIEYEREIDED